MKKNFFILLIALITSCNKSNDTVNINPNMQDSISTASAEIKSNPLKEAYFGETHIHTSASMDAFIGSTRISPEEAYLFAMGEELLVNGSKHKLKVPLDFCAISDHSEYIGETYTLNTPGSPGYDDPIATSMRTTDDYEEALALFVKYVITPARSGPGMDKHPPFYQGEASLKSGWRKNFEATEKYNRPGKFTTLHAFEWTASFDAGNLHRNVIFGDTIFPAIPYTTHESTDPEKLWQWMKEQQDKGSKVLAIPHNSNGSKGYMFPETTIDGKPVTQEYAALRQEMEPLIEMMQIKGNSEVHASFWSNDEFSNFENANTVNNYSGRKLKENNFVRYGLKRGLKYEEDLGVNPFKYGFAGGTDNHNGAPGDVDEDNFTVGSHGWADRSAKDRANNEIDGWAMAWDINPGSLTGAWAPSNTRIEIWNAMKRKETFATSGPRIKVRFFAGYDYANSYTSYEELVKAGYATGVPMGGDLALQEGKAPKFIVWAIKDPNNAGLDRIQIIKGWLENGKMKEAIYNVAVSDDRTIKADGSVEKLNAAVDLTTGAYATDKGSTELKAVWTDPKFDPKQMAFYYVRVIQIPTARWHVYDEIREKIKFTDKVPKTVQERAWSSPIWYTPTK